MSKQTIRVGISSCLLGEEVRFDGGHKHDTLITATLGKFFDWVPVCPEMEIGLGTPRESLRLVGIASSPKLLAPRSGTDHTGPMQHWAKEKLEQLRRADLHGYILKKDSPSCGMERVRVYGESGMPQRNGRGLFAAALLEQFPWLPADAKGATPDTVARNTTIVVLATTRSRSGVKQSKSS